MSAPLDGRKVPLKRRETKKVDVEAFFSFLYTILAEPLAIASKDRLDKSKWLVPRNLDSSKMLERLWRPALHVVGVLVARVLEYFAIVQPDVKGDSDTQQTVISRALELAENELRKKGKNMPWKLIIHSDNTSKEGRNSFMLQYCSALVWGETFSEASLAFFRVGHTHNRLDQRFSVIGSISSLHFVLTSATHQPWPP